MKSLIFSILLVAGIAFGQVSGPRGRAIKADQVLLDANATYSVITTNLLQDAIEDLDSAVWSNSEAIASNTTEIASNTTEIASNTTEIASNATAIASNATAVTFDNYFSGAAHPGPGAPSPTTNEYLVVTGAASTWINIGGAGGDNNAYAYTHPTNTITPRWTANGYFIAPADGYYAFSGRITFDVPAGATTRAAFEVKKFNNDPTPVLETRGYSRFSTYTPTTRESAYDTGTMQFFFLLAGEQVGLAARSSVGFSHIDQSYVKTASLQVYRISTRYIDGQVTEED